MACVTLKRPLDFDPLEVLHSPNRPPTKRRRCTPIKNVDRSRSQPPSSRLSCASAAATASIAPSPSVFCETPITKEEISNNLKNELKHMKRRRKLAAREISGEMTSSSIYQEGNTPSTSVSTDQFSLSYSTSRASENSFCQMPQLISKGSHSTSNIQRNSSNIPLANGNSIASLMSKGDKKVFSLNEMTLICEKMCKERTDAVRQEYDKILHQKLSEQYDAFVKFIDHQIKQRFNESQQPSYLS